MNRRRAARWPERERSRWSAELLTDEGLSETAFRVGFCLAPFFSKSSEVRPVEAAIAKKLGVTIDAVRAAIDELAQREHLKLVHAEGPGDRQFRAWSS